MYKNPIFCDIIPQKTINSYSNIIFFQNSLKYFKYASISPTIFFQKNSPHPSCCYSNLRRWGDGDGEITWGGEGCGGIALGSRRRRRWRCRRCLRRGVRRGQNA